MNRFNVRLDGKSLSDIHPSIRIIDVKEHAPVIRAAAVSTALGDGLRVTHRSRESLSVTVSFVIREYIPGRRSVIMQEIRAWARGTTLKTSLRSGMQLSVEAEELPTVQSALKWTDTCAITFTARETPYWVEAQAVHATAALPILAPLGDALPSPADFTWTADRDGLVTLLIQTPLSSITLASLQVTTGQTLALGHTHGLLTATLDGADVLLCRTAESSDDLLVTCGIENQITVKVNGADAAAFTMSARGRWL